MKREHWPKVNCFYCRPSNLKVISRMKSVWRQKTNVRTDTRIFWHVSMLSLMKQRVWGFIDQATSLRFHWSSNKLGLSVIRKRVWAFGTHRRRCGQFITLLWCFFSLFKIYMSFWILYFVVNYPWASTRTRGLRLKN